MKSMKKTLLYCLLFILFGAKSQSIDFSNYRPLQSTGIMPSDISKQLSDHYEKRKDDVNNESSEIKKYGSEYALNSSYYLNQILKSGKLLYGDPMSNYVNRVADNLLINQPELKENLRFYVIRVPFVNAFALDPGVIIVTTGLLAQIENEAQLAFVLSHEIIHILKKHSIDLYLTGKKLGRSKDDSNPQMVDSRIYKYHYRSRIHENEADKLGVAQFLSKSEYKLDVIDGVFDVLQFGHLPFDELPDYTKYFENNFYKFPDNLILKETKPISTLVDEDDTLSTHPNIKNRRITMNNYIKEFDGANRKLFIQPKEIFLTIRDIARFETIHAQIIDHDYINASYNIFIMLKAYPENSFLESAMTSCLYGISKYKTNGYSNEIIDSYKDKEGNIQQIFYFFTKLNRKEINILALRYSWIIHQKQPNNEYLTNICKDLMLDLKNQKINLDDFSDVTPSDTLLSENDTTFRANSKYDRIKDSSNQKIKSSPKFTNEFAYLTYAFVDLKTDQNFIKSFNNIKDIDDDTFNYTFLKKSKKGACLGIDSIIVFNPYFMKFDERKKNSIRIITSESKEISITKKTEDIAKKIKLNAPIISSHKFTPNDEAYYNDYCSISSWVEEFNNVNQNFPMIFYQSQYMHDIIQKYNSNYLNLIGIASIIRKKTVNDIFNLIIYSSVVFAIPIVIYELITPTYNSIFSNQLVNINNGEVIFSNYQYFDQNSRHDNINSRIYDSFNQIKSQRK